MAIYFNENEQTFHLQNSKISYLFTVLKNGYLGHLYFGKKVRHRDSFTHLIQKDNTRELLKQEYPAYGNTDFRSPAYQIQLENGSTISDLRYLSHKIYKGKPKLEGLPATYVENEDEAD
ncbi:MAG: glycoside hydrolase clan, partial [Fusobacteriales bacterium]|nr:glycoside hydrolase clan [Fusobacteriales bacterium]